MPRDEQIRRATPADYRAIFQDHALGPVIFEDLTKRFLKEPKLDGTQEGLVLTAIYAAQRRMLDFIIAMASQDDLSNIEKIAQSETPEATYVSTPPTENNDE